jgi:hypothetical protein
VRASRSFPFVSKVSGYNFAQIAAEAILGVKNDTQYQTLELDRVGVKSPQFSYNRIKGADPVANVEMASTGEVACMGQNILEAFGASWLATDQNIHGRAIFLSISDQHKYKFIDEAKELAELGWQLYTTPGTHTFLKQNGVVSTKLYKIHQKRKPSVELAVLNQTFALMINVPSPSEDSQDAYSIRRLAIDNHIPIITNAELGKLLLGSLAENKLTKLPVVSWQEYQSKEI